MREEHVLRETVEIDFVAQDAAVVRHRALLAHANGDVRPARPHAAAEVVLQRHEEREVVDVFMRLGERVHHCFHAIEVLLKAQVQPLALETLHGVKVGGGAGLKALCVLGLHQAVAHQKIQVDQIDIARVRAVALIGRLAISRRSDGQHLPDRHTGLFQKVHKRVGVRAQRTDSARRGERCDMQKHAAFSHG